MSTNIIENLWQSIKGFRRWFRVKADVTAAVDGAVQRFNQDTANQAGEERQGRIIAPHAKEAQQAKPRRPDIALSIPQGIAALMANCKHSDVECGFNVRGRGDELVATSITPLYVCLKKPLREGKRIIGYIPCAYMMRDKCGAFECSNLPEHTLIDTYTTE